MLVVLLKSLSLKICCEGSTCMLDLLILLFPSRSSIKESYFLFLSFYGVTFIDFVTFSAILHDRSRKDFNGLGVKVESVVPLYVECLEWVSVEGL